MSDVREKAPTWLAGLMATVGSAHFVATDFMAQTMPRWVPAQRAVVLGSGVVEVACAIGLFRREKWAGPVSAAVLLAIWPANIQMALDAGTGRNKGIADNKAVMWARVPMQIPMIWAALQVKPRAK